MYKKGYGRPVKSWKAERIDILKKNYKTEQILLKNNLAELILLNSCVAIAKEEVILVLAMSLQCSTFNAKYREIYLACIYNSSFE